jgi:hypothetical protein
VTLGGGAVPGSPFAVEVGPAALDPQQCYLANPRAEMRCDVPETLELQVSATVRDENKRGYACGVTYRKNCHALLIDDEIVRNRQKNALRLAAPC